MLFSYTHANKTQKINHKMKIIIKLQNKISSKIIGLFYNWPS